MRLAGLMLSALALILSSACRSSNQSGQHKLLVYTPHGQDEDEAKRLYEFVTTPESLIHSGRNYHRLPIRKDIDRAQLPDWMNAPFTRMPLDWELLRKQGNEWLRYWDTEIRGRGKQKLGPRIANILSA